MVFLQTGQLLSTKESREERGSVFSGDKTNQTKKLPPPLPSPQKAPTTFCHILPEILSCASYSSVGFIPTYFMRRIVKHMTNNL